MESPRFAYRRDRVVSFAGDLEIRSVFEVNFMIKCETKFGECCCIVGSIDELGAWKTPVHLKWTENHIWTLEQPIQTKTEHFTYKYVIMEGQNVIWEHGVNRIADLKVLAIQAKDNKDTLVIDDIEFNHFKVKIAVHFPLNSLQYMEF